MFSEKTDVATSQRLLDAIETTLRKVLQELFPTNSEVYYQGAKEEDKFFTRKKAASFLGISLTSLYYLQRQNKIKYYRIGNKVFFKKEDLLAVYVVRELLTKEEGGCHE